MSYSPALEEGLTSCAQQLQLSSAQLMFEAARCTAGQMVITRNLKLTCWCQKCNGTKQLMTTAGSSVMDVFDSMFMLILNVPSWISATAQKYISS